MKHLSEEEKIRLQRLALRRAERNILRSAKNKDKSVVVARLSHIKKMRYRAFSRPIPSLEVPSVLSLSTNYDAVVRIAQDLGFITLSQRKPAGINFSNVQSVGPAAALYLAAEIYRCRYFQTKHLRVIGMHPKDDIIARHLMEMGFNSLLDIKDPETSAGSSAIQYIKYKTSKIVSGSLAVELREALESGSSAIPPKIRQAIYASLTEAMSNVIHHAYPLLQGRPMHVMRGRWWMAGSIDHQKNELMIIFYDQGVGIPATLPIKHPAEIWRKILSNLGLRANDGTMIKAATLLGRTRTEEPNRGRGLQDVIEFIKICEGGELRILSNRGEYIYRNDGSEHIQNHRRNLGGTLIQWRVFRQPMTSGDDDDIKHH